jgi:hypothetical protein
MAKENVKKFYDLLNGSEELQKELQKRDMEYAKGHEAPSDDASDEEKAEARLAAVKEIVLPLAQEQGLEFTVDEMIEYEKELLGDADAELDRGELRNVAGGYTDENTGMMFCFLVGVGMGEASRGRGGCFLAGFGFAFHCEV